MFKIETDVPIPVNPRASGPARDPDSFVGTMRRLAVGETFFAPGKSANTASASARVMRQRDGVTSKFTCRTVTENGAEGVRVWRVS